MENKVSLYLAQKKIKQLNKIDFTNKLNYLEVLYNKILTWDLSQPLNIDDLEKKFKTNTDLNINRINTIYK